jgi:pimeloyl-ACP methyl ester carboxylesterase
MPDFFGLTPEQQLVDSKGRPLKRREMLQTFGSASVLGLFSNALSTQAWAQDVRPFTVRGSGPALIVFDRQPRGYYDQLTDRYRVVVIADPAIDNSPAGIASLTADRVCADILAVADAAGVDRFAWYGFSFGSVVGLQLASRTSRLSALVCGGWPPLGGQYAETLAFTEEEAAQGRATPALTFYRSIRGWPERDAVSKFTFPRMAFAGNRDEFVAGDQRIRIGPIIAEQRADLERMGWTVQLIDGFGHELGGRPDVIMPILKRFLDPTLLR